MARGNRSNKEVRMTSIVQRKKRREMDVEDGRKFSPKFDNERESKIVHINPKTTGGGNCN